MIPGISGIFGLSVAVGTSREAVPVWVRVPVHDPLLRLRCFFESTPSSTHDSTTTNQPVAIMMFRVSHPSFPHGIIGWHDWMIVFGGV